MDGENQDIAAFFADVPAKGTRKPRAPKVEPVEGSLAEAEAEGRKLSAREERKAARLAKTETVRHVGPGPAADTRPRCHFCNDHRQLTPELVEVVENEGTPGERKVRVRLCAFCASCYEADRAKRCLACGEPSSLRLLGGLCLKCRTDNGGALVNLIQLVKLRWVGVIRG